MLVCVRCACVLEANLRKKFQTDTHKTLHTCQHLLTQPSPHYTKTHNPRLPTPQHNTTLLVHRAPQLIADPAPNPLLGHHITQSHVQVRQGVHAPQTCRNGAAEPIGVEVPDATARGASVVVVWCTAMIHACLGCGVCWSRIVVAWDARPRSQHRGA